MRHDNATRRLDGSRPPTDGGRMDRLSAIAVKTAKLLDLRRLPGYVDGPARTAVVLGTTTGSVPRMVQVTHDSLTAGGVT